MSGREVRAEVELVAQWFRSWTEWKSSRLRRVNWLWLFLVVCLAGAGALLVSQLVAGPPATGARYRGEQRGRRGARDTGSPNDGLRDPFASRPRIRSRNGHLVIEASQDKSIEFRTSGARGSVSINGVAVEQLVQVSRALERLGGPGAALNGSERLADGSDRYEALLGGLLGSGARLGDHERRLEELNVKLGELAKQLGGQQRKLVRRLEELSRLAQAQEKLSKLVRQDECLSEESGRPVCKNGAQCVDLFAGFKCLCPAEWEGLTCEQDVDECARFRGTQLGCQNGARCVNLAGGYRCECAANYHGVHCTEQHDECALSSSAALCGHGKCLGLAGPFEPGQARYECLCEQGWTSAAGSPACVQDVDECAQNASSAGAPQLAYPCSQSPLVECTNLAGSFRCAACPAGYTGNGRLCRDLDECLLDNGGCSQLPLVACINTEGSRRCGPCPAGYSGDGLTCARVGACGAQPNGGCHPMARCLELDSSEPLCVCQWPFRGAGLGLDGCRLPEGVALLPATPPPAANQTERARLACAASNCQNGATCELVSGWPAVAGPANEPEPAETETGSEWQCLCAPGWQGRLCDRPVLGCGAQLFASHGQVSFPWRNGRLLDELELETKLVAEQETASSNSKNGKPSSKQVRCRWSISGPARNKWLELKLSKLAKQHQLYLANESSTGLPVASNCAETLDVFELLPPDVADSGEERRLVARLCGAPAANRAASSPARPPLSLVTESSRAELLFSWSAPRNWPGSEPVAQPGLSFRLDWRQTEPACGARLDLDADQTGSFGSPRFPEFYPAGSECRYLLRAPAGQRIRVQLAELLLLEGPRWGPACADSLTVLDGWLGTDRPVLWRHCANQNQTGAAPRAAPALLSSGPQLELVLHSRPDSRPPASLRRSQRRGLYFTYAAEPAPVGCGGGLFTRASASLASADFEPGAAAGRSLLYDQGLLGAELGAETRLLRRLAQRRPRQIRCEFELRPAGLRPQQRLGLDWLEMPDVLAGEEGASSQQQVSPAGGEPALRWSRLARCLRASLRVYEAKPALQPNQSEYPNPNPNPNQNQSELALFCAGDSFNASLSGPILSSARRLYLIYETPADSASGAGQSAPVSGGFRLHYSPHCRVTVRLSPSQPVGQLEALLEPGMGQCYYHLLAPLNHSLALQASQPTWNRQPGGQCPAQALFVDGAGELDAPALSHNQRQLRLFRESLSQPEASSTEQTSAASGDWELNLNQTQRQQLNPPTSSSRAGDPEALLVDPSTGASLGLNPGDAPISSNNNRSSVSMQSRKEIQYWQYSAASNDHQQADHWQDVKEFDACQLEQLSLQSVWNQLTLLLRFGPGFEASSSNRLALTLRFMARPSCGGIISEPTEGVLNLGLNYRNASSGQPKDAPSIDSSNCSFILRAPQPRQLVQLSLVETRIETIEQRLNQWRDWRKTNAYLSSNQSSNSSAALLPPECYHVFMEQIELYEPALNRTRLLCPSELLLGFSSSGSPTRNKSSGTAAQFDSVKSISASTSSSWLTSQSNTVMLRLRNIIPPPNTTLWPARRPLREKLELQYRFVPARSLQGCGGRLMQDSGIIRSPRFPNTYPANMDCVWLIQAESGQQIRLNFSHFDLEPSSGGRCKHDFLELRNGPTSDSALIGRFCGQQLRWRILLSHSNFVWMRLVSDQRDSGPGFQVRFDGAQTGCGGQLSSSSGQIDSPNYPNPSYLAARCEWLIETARATKIQLNLQDLDFGLPAAPGSDRMKQDECPSNASLLTIYELDPDSSRDQERDESSVMIARVCRESQLKGLDNRNLLSRTNRLLLVYQSRGFMLEHNRGFRLSYRTICKDIQVRGLHGVIESPGFPDIYEPDLNCDWHIKSYLGSNLSLAITDLQLETRRSPNLPCTNDRLEVYKPDNGSTGPLVASICGSLERMSSQERLIHLDSDSAIVKFQTDESLQMGGFRLEWQAHGCGQQLSQTDSGTISFHEPAASGRAFECLWIINADPTKMVSSFLIGPYSPLSGSQEISLRSDMRTPEDREPCKDASLSVYDGLTDEAPVLSENCDTLKQQETLSTSSGHFLVRFYSSGRHQVGRWFTLSFWPSRVECLGSDLDVAGSLNGWAGDRRSPGYPNQFPAQPFHCTAFLRSLHGRLRFRLDELELGTVAAAPNPSGGSDEGSTKLEQVPGLPDPRACRASESYLRLRTFGLTRTQSLFCGKLPAGTSPELVLEQESALLEFVSSARSLDSARGRWRLSFGRLCGALIHLDQLKTLSTANYPEPPNWPATSVHSAQMSERVCLWRLNAPAQSKQQSDQTKAQAESRIYISIVDLIFDANSSYSSGNQMRDCVRIYEGLQISLKQSSFNLTDIQTKLQPVVQICSSADLKYSALHYVSRGSEVLVLTSGSVALKFQASPFTNQCGSELRLKQAEFASQTYPLPYGPNLDCHYFIQSSPGAQIKLNFIDFELSQEEDISNGDDSILKPQGNYDSLANQKCDNQDYVEIRTLSLRNKLEAKLAPSNMAGIMYRWTRDSLLVLMPEDSMFQPQQQNQTNWTSLTPASKQANHLLELVKVYHLMQETWDPRKLSQNRLNLYLDDFHERSQLIGRFCGRTAPDLSQVSLRDELLIRFRSHSARENLSGGRGFLAEYKLELGGQIELLDDDSKLGGYIASPSYPIKVRNNQTITWFFVTSQDWLIHLELVSLNLGSYQQACTDTLSVLDGGASGRRLVQLCGHLSFRSSQLDVSGLGIGTLRQANRLQIVHQAYDPIVRAALVKPVLSSGNTASVVYSNYQHDGYFLLRYKAIPRDDPLNMAQQNKSIGEDSAEIWPPPSMISNQLPVDSYSTADISTILRSSNSSCSYTVRLSSSSANASQLWLESPNWPREPPSDIECHWLIYTEENTSIQVSISASTTDTSSSASSGELEFAGLASGWRQASKTDSCLDIGSVEPKNFIVIHDGASQLAPVIVRHCLPAPPMQFHSRARHLLIRYVHSQLDKSSNGLGLQRSLFRAKASLSQCGGQYFIGYGKQISDRPSGRDKIYGNNLNCWYYLFTGDPKRVITLTNELNKFNLSSKPSNQDCSVGDYMEIRDLPMPVGSALSSLDSSMWQPESGRLLGRFCAGKPFESLESPGSAISILFKTDSENGAKGWQLMARSMSPRLSCPRGYSVLNKGQPFGQLVSPNWPHGFHGKRTCRYLLSAPSVNQHLELTFLHLKRAQMYDTCNQDSLQYLDDNEADLLRYDSQPLRELQSMVSGPLMRSLVQQVPCKNPVPTSMDQLKRLEAILPKTSEIASGFKSLSAEQYLQLKLGVQPNQVFQVKTESRTLLLEYESVNLQPNEGFFAIFRAIDKDPAEQAGCGGDISYKPNDNSASNLIRSARFGQESSEDDPYIQCEWQLHGSTNSFDYVDYLRPDIDYEQTPVENVGSFNLAYLVFNTIEIPSLIPGTSLMERWSTDRSPKSIETCGLNRLLLADAFYSWGIIACGNLTATKWLILEPGSRRFTLRTKNLRLAPKQNSNSAQVSTFYRGLQAYFYETNCLQVERLVGEGIRIKSHSSYPRTSYAPGICKWDLTRLSGGDYEFWFAGIKLRSGNANYTGNSNDCDPNDAEADYLEIRAGTKNDSPVLRRYCARNLASENQKTVLINMRKEISIKFVAGISRLAKGFDYFEQSNESSKKASTNGSLTSSTFGFEMILVRTRNDTAGKFCHRNSALSIYRFITPKSFFSESSLLFAPVGPFSSFLYPNNTHCVVQLSMDESMQLNFTFRGRFDLEPSPACQNDYVQLDDLVPSNKSISTSKRNNNLVIDMQEYEPKLLGRWCGRDRPTNSIISSSNRVRITFHSNERIEGKGFLLEYSIIQPSNSSNTSSI